MKFSGFHSPVDTKTTGFESWKMFALFFLLLNVTHMTITQISILLTGFSSLNIMIFFWFLSQTASKGVSKTFLEKPYKINENVAK